MIYLFFFKRRRTNEKTNYNNKTKLTENKFSQIKKIKNHFIKYLHKLTKIVFSFLKTIFGFLRHHFLLYLGIICKVRKVCRYTLVHFGEKNYSKLEWILCKKISFKFSLNIHFKIVIMYKYIYEVMKGSTCWDS